MARPTYFSTNFHASLVSRFPSRLSRRLLAFAGIAILAAPLATPARAQALRAPSYNSVAAGETANRNQPATPNSTGLPGAAARQSITTGEGSGSGVSILGMPLRAAAPVNSPYNSGATSTTFAGQPMTGKDAILQQSIDGAP